ncbi:piwi-like protein Ago3 isoform X1 [Hylaeus anthracinus]|uniref:piwi-like protein Ago3 isoform X1 n=2 Tax=Hylaeus anthracinus TaxID=313031 RepID=UPI0023B9B407|nr:piwi-like protein Ago3 isoform X1 [Hylaeus anthracinus]XP_053999070.1 piwi-like protein Ago3 isoform X1 [Hylaeus anthracinus]
MDNDRGKQMSKGRGGILLRMIMEKEKAEAEAKAAAAAQSLSMTSSTADILPNPCVGIGRAKLLEMVVQRKSDTVNPSLLQTPTTGQGRASILSRIKATSSVGQHIEQPIARQNVPESSADDQGMLGKLSDLTVQDTTQTSTSSHPKDKPISRQGTSGKPIQLSANYINLKLIAKRCLFNYEIKFNPDIDSRPLRSKLLYQQKEVLGETRVFDGVMLYLPKKLQTDRTVLQSTHPMDGSTVTLTLTYKKEQSMSENIPFFNVLLGRVMRSLSLIRMGRHNLNPKGVHSVPQHKLEVWPGYVTAINEYDGGLKLCIDVKHRVMRTETVRDIMVNFGKDPNFQQKIMRELIGLSVFTRYNNKTYRVDDIAWEKDPTYTFQRENDKISLVDYYKQHWNLQIKDLGQPLLVHCSKTKLPAGGTQERLILLVPELCYIATLTESIRSDFRVMKDLDAITKMSPNARRAELRQFVQQIKDNEVPRQILANWGLELESDIVDFCGRALEPEEICFGNNRKFTAPPNRPAEWSSAACRNVVYRTTNLNQWCVLHCQKDTRCAQEFVSMFKNVAKVMGISVRDPHMVCLRDDRIETYVQELRRNIQQTVNLAIIIFPTNRTDRYSAVKRVCCVEMPIPSQVIMSRTISRGDKLKSITEKIALQINCKLGGALWALAVPMDNCMICGIDVYHAGIGQSTKGSVAGFVASLDKALTTWHSKICLQGRHQELVDMLQICLISAIKAYYKHNKLYPDRIIVYRDGVGDGQIETVTKYEVKQMLATFKNIEPSYQPTLTVVIVHKRINTRLFTKASKDLQNPPPGTIVDSHITKSADLYDFFLVSQNIRMGTVSPTHYIVAYDNKNMKAEHIQRLTYKLCHLYYNWPGTIKVPAPCQYAHKLVSLVGQNLQLEPNPSLSDTLYYL